MEIKCVYVLKARRKKQNLFHSARVPIYLSSKNERPIQASPSKYIRINNSRLSALMPRARKPTCGGVDGKFATFLTRFNSLGARYLPKKL